MLGTTLIQLLPGLSGISWPCASKKRGVSPRLVAAPGDNKGLPIAKESGWTATKEVEANACAAQAVFNDVGRFVGDILDDHIF